MVGVRDLTHGVSSPNTHAVVSKRLVGERASGQAGEQVTDSGFGIARAVVTIGSCAIGRPASREMKDAQLHPGEQAVKVRRGSQR